MIHDRLASLYDTAADVLEYAELDELAETAERKQGEHETRYRLSMAHLDREVTTQSVYGASRSWYRGALREAREYGLDDMEEQVIDDIWGEVRTAIRYDHQRTAVDHLDYWSDRGEIDLDEAPDRLDEELLEKAPLQEEDGSYELQHMGYTPEHRRHDPDFSPEPETPHHI
ncbi:MAG: hypothetical protein SV186_05840 [Candidatus Nanohaloarchaea archaeon]|nr:hypothetical protein [Candidatus Nanohaloarchaea archaeon]